MELVEQPRAISIVIAFMKASSFMMSRGRIFFSSSSMIFIPVCLAKRIRALMTAGIVPLPGKCHSENFCQTVHGVSCKHAGTRSACRTSLMFNFFKLFLQSILPVLNAATPSKAETKDNFFLPIVPALIAPPETKNCRDIKSSSSH